MFVRSIPKTQPVKGDAEQAPTITVVKMSGPVDRNATIVREARRVLEKLGEPEALVAFDKAVENEAFILDK